jgi:hypothetical protein
MIWSKCIAKWGRTGPFRIPFNVLPTVPYVNMMWPHFITTIDRQQSRGACAFVGSDGFVSSSLFISISMSFSTLSKLRTTWREKSFWVNSSDENILLTKSANIVDLESKRGDSFVLCVSGSALFCAPLIWCI